MIMIMRSRIVLTAFLERILRDRAQRDYCLDLGKLVSRIAESAAGLNEAITTMRGLRGSMISCRYLAEVITSVRCDRSMLPPYQADLEKW